jgi:hypothetical protein
MKSWGLIICVHLTEIDLGGIQQHDEIECTHMELFLLFIVKYVKYHTSERLKFLSIYTITKKRSK